MPTVSKSVIALLFLLMYACAQQPGTSVSLEADQEEQIEGVGFLHQVWFNSGSGGELYVFIHGDGMPWLSRDKIALNPTTDHKTSFALWANTSGPAYMLGRPCYFDTVIDDSARCHPGYWTNARYSEDVVVSLASVVRELSRRHPENTLHLVGFSGGGVLATLIAQRVETVTRLTTFASPLDTEAWVKHHDFSPLDKSLNPANFVLRSDLEQRHVFGAKDNNVEPGLAKRFFEGNGAEAIVVNKADHDCCWLEAWRELQLKQRK